MKTCSSHRQNIALLAAGALNGAENEQLQAHFKECSACRQYFQEMTRVCARFSAAEKNLPEVQNGEAFHNRLVARVQNHPAPRANDPQPQEQPNFSLSAIYKHLFSSPWKWALSGTLAVLLVIVLFPIHDTPITPKLHSLTAKHPPVSTALEEPTLLNYQRAAGQSWEALDALLASEANKAKEPGILVTASTRTLKDLTE